MKAHPLFPYFLEKLLADTTSPFFHLLVNGFVYLVSVLFCGHFTWLILVGGSGGQGENKKASASTLSEWANQGYHINEPLLVIKGL